MILRKLKQETDEKGGFLYGSPAFETRYKTYQEMFNILKDFTTT